MTADRTLIPSARRLMTSLRGLPYDLPGAIADLVDNCLDADATHVAVTIDSGWRGAFITIADDGLGMSERQLDEAMRYGSSRDYAEEDLGHFGLGLKTASLSQCRRLTVASRTGSGPRIRIRRWDLDRVAEQDAWVLERPHVRDCRPQLTLPLKEHAGTVVMWEELDRVLGARKPTGDAASKRLHAAAAEVSTHLGMVFHRFLDGEAAGPSFAITVNGDPVAPWDPFARSEPMTQELPAQRLSIEFDDETHDVVVRPYILPSQQQFSSPEAHAAASGPKLWNRQQGLYIYRRDRLIQSGGWNRLRTQDEHSKLARLVVDIPSPADAAFRTDVAKMFVGLPDELRPQLRVLIAGVVARAQETYRQRVRLVPGSGTDGGQIHDDSPDLLGRHWQLITSVLERELSDHAELLDRVLVSLVNARLVAAVPQIERAVG